MGRGHTTAVVGGGCSGVLAAVHLLRHSTDAVVMLEPSGELGAGIAYRTAEPVHVLNSRAAAMSADVEDPAHFVAWARRTGRPVGPAGFAARRDYGRYLHETLDAAAAAEPGRFTHVRARATGLRLDGDVELATNAAGHVRAERVVLALGHAGPASPSAIDPAVRRHPHYVADPWQTDALDAVPLDAPVLLIGTGLTAVDVALSLTGRGLRAPIHAVSRHGLLPQAHPTEPAAASRVSMDATGVGQLIAQFRAAARTEDWPSVVDGFRPHVNARWQAWTTEQQRRFLRHAARHWEVHRHRMAPSAAIVTRGLLADGALRVSAASLASVSVAATGFVATARSGAGWRVGAIVNCTGPRSAAASAFGRRLLADGVARPDPLGLGFDVDRHGRLVSRVGRASDRLLVLGPPRLGRWFETTAVPEIREQARTLVEPAPAELLAA